jgi:hypothetical protein
MTKLDLVLARVKALSAQRQEELAVEIEYLLDDEGPFLTDEQWADLRQRAAADTGERISHDEIVAEFSPKSGR